MIFRFSAYYREPFKLVPPCGKLTVQFPDGGLKGVTKETMMWLAGFE